MKFCRQCGQTLSLFANSKEEYCRECLPLKPDNAMPSKSDEKPADIFSATLSHENGKIVLKSKEGWLLWSGSDGDEHTLQQIIDRAAPVLKIRARRKT